MKAVIDFSYLLSLGYKPDQICQSLGYRPNQICSSRKHLVDVVETSAARFICKCECWVTELPAGENSMDDALKYHANRVPS